MATLEPRSGSEQRGTRPVLLVSSDLFNSVQNWRSLIVAPLTTSSRNLRRGPSCIAVSAGTAGLRQDSFVLCHQVTTLDRAKIGRRLGELPAAALEEVAEGLRVAMAID
ncbi:MAG: hypothetical protein FD180_4774 [Planctomycetota bacterium]|nr:MAG: hypothetical protein FD180_4774 [Planctomycetota bacterium]